MKTVKKLAFIALCIIAISACKKNNDTTTTPVETPKTKKDYLMEGKWMITSIRVSVPGLGNSDLCDTMPECRKDNWAKFMSSGKILSDEGVTKCSSSAMQQDSTGTWMLTDDFSKLTANVNWVPSSNKTFTVLELTQTALKMAQSFDTTISVGVPFPIKVTVKDTVTAKNIN